MNTSNTLHIIGVLPYGKYILNSDIKAPAVKLSLIPVLITFQRYTPVSLMVLYIKLTLLPEHVIVDVEEYYSYEYECYIKLIY